MSDTLLKALPGPKVLLEGPSGTGKTYALGTLVDWAAANGKETFILFTESGAETLAGYWTDRGMPIPDSLHWHLSTTSPNPLKSLVEWADRTGKLSYEALKSAIDPDRAKNNAFHRILSSCVDFPCDRCGKQFGSVDSWDTSRIFGIDSLSELSNAAMKMEIGSRPTAGQHEFGVAQNNLMNFLRLCTQGLTCTFVMTAHVQRQTDDLSQTTKIMTKAIGKAIADEIPPLFSDVIYTVREGDKFYWDTAAYGVDTKTRSLGYRSKIEPNYALIMDKWKARGGK